MPERDDSAIAAAGRFWSRYEIPFEHDTAIKVRRSGLLRGSSGTGHARDTVVHLHIKEAFTDGRLSRSDDSWLCENDSYVPRDGREERFVEDGEEYVPPVTCETCLDRMERWKTAVTDGGAAVGSYDDLQPEPEQPTDRNPSMPCEICGESFAWLDYWEERILDGDGDPREASFWCDDCEAEVETTRRQLSHNTSLDEWGGDDA